MAYQLRPTLPRILFSSSLSPLVISATDGESQIKLSLILNDVQIFENTYIFPPKAESSSSVTLTIYGLDKIVATAMDQSSTMISGVKGCIDNPATLKIKGDDSTLSSALVYYCRQKVAEGALTFIDKYYLSTGGNRIEVPPSGDVFAYFISGGETEEIKVVTSLIEDGTLSTSTKIYKHYQAKNQITGFESIAPEGAGIMTIIVGNRQKTFCINPSLSADAVCFRFVNSFGVPDCLYCYGASEIKTSATYSDIQIGGNLQTWQADLEESHTSSTGLLDVSSRRIAIDLFRSKKIYVKAKGDNAFRAAIIAGIDATFGEDGQTVNSYSITWRYSEPLPIIKDNDSLGIFDETFDETFE